MLHAGIVTGTAWILAGCGGEPAHTSAGPTPPTAQQERQARLGPADPTLFAREARDAFRRTAGRLPPAIGGKRARFASLSPALPIAEPPLPVRQYVTTQSSTDLIARVDPVDWACRGTPADRRAAVQAFARQAIAFYRSRGFPRVTIRIVELGTRLDDIRVLATQRGGIARLTSRGRAGDCQTAASGNAAPRRDHPPPPPVAENRFERLVGELPLHEPPLYVAQTITAVNSHRLVARPTARRFFCDRTPQQRLAAVLGYYRDAERRMRAAGIRDFVLVVDALRDTGYVKPLAVARHGTARLTAVGRGGTTC